MANSETSVAQTILYLRPQTAVCCNEVLDIPANEPYVFNVPPPPEPVDIPLGGNPDLFPSTHSTYSPLHDHSRGSRESTPGLYSISPRVLRLGFDTIQEPSGREFEFGSRDSSDVKVPYNGDKTIENAAYFRVHYNFSSGALMITALDKIKVGSARLKPQQSLLLLAGTNIHCGGDFGFEVEFPDVNNCAEQYERNYQEFAAKSGFPDAPYLISSREDLPPIGAEHKSKAIIGKGSYGEVHKALNIRDGKAFAIKVLTRGGGERAMKEVNIMSELCHENIIKYERAFRLPSGETCIVMELAVNDLKTFQEAKQSSKRRSYLPLQYIRSIGWQALSGLEYLHGKGFTHRDLKPENILVTKWDAKTDTVTIKLADFGLTGIGSEHQTFCGTKDYVAPEVMEARNWAIRLEEETDSQMETSRPDPPLTYTNAVDIWALGKILLELLESVPSHLPSSGGTSRPFPKAPAFSLVNRMLRDIPSLRPSAAECLKDPWMATNGTADSQLPQKRGRSPAPYASSTTSSTERPIRKICEEHLPRAQQP